MSMVGQRTYFLCLQVKQSADRFFISQEKCAKNLIKKFELESCKSPRTPISTSTKLSKDNAGQLVDFTVYRSLIGSLLYLTASPPHIIYSVGMCARYQSAPKESHLIAAKRILKYVKGTEQYGLWYSKENNVCLVAYCDVDWAGNVDDRKSTSRGCFFIRKKLISWLSKKQNSISLSTAEAQRMSYDDTSTLMLMASDIDNDVTPATIDDTEDGNRAGAFLKFFGKRALEWEDIIRLRTSAQEHY
ncbi:PREDICTED: uncharacterized protein LOC109191137 [Ipomoea nil]|uniref:uncharacterized protein LOC109191137 n=1 Tax=Ipomoea nil TaxID=35883 RepID=UPI0009010428|nr:PREDICTED: uncharacterized protein LOC109191137 [Ipomoea nil]